MVSRDVFLEYVVPCVPWVLFGPLLELLLVRHSVRGPDVYKRQELISYFLAQAGLSKMKLSSKTYPTRKMLPIRKQTAVQAITAVNAAWGDVYKRQPIALGRQRNITRRWASKRHLREALDVRDEQIVVPKRSLLGPVSYTHLDVYKRQVHAHTVRNVCLQRSDPEVQKLLPLCHRADRV